MHRFIVLALLLIATPTLACLKNDECDTGCCRSTQCQPAEVCEGEATQQAAAVPQVPAWVWGLSLGLFAIGGGHLVRRRRHRQRPLAAPVHTPPPPSVSRYVGALLLLCGCAGGTQSIKAMAIDCAGVALGAEVQAAIECMRDFSNYAGCLEQRSIAAGLKVVACAVSEGSKQLGGTLAGTGPLGADGDREAAENGRRWLAGRGVVVR